VDPTFQPLIDQGWEPALNEGRQRIAERFEQHMQFVRDRQAAGKAIKHTNRVYGFPVMTRQETELMVPLPAALQKRTPHRLSIVYETPTLSAGAESAALPEKPQPGDTRQLSLFD
jgi:hypothetical protein